MPTPRPPHSDEPRHGHSLWTALLTAALLLLLSRCDTMAPPGEGQLVVEAFIQTGEPLPTITLRQTESLTVAPSDTAVRPARNATVSVQLNGRVVPYRAVTGQPGRYAPETSVTVPPQVPYELSVRWQGQVATAAGRTPPPVRIESIQVEVPPEPVEAILIDSLQRDTLGIPAEEGLLYPVEVTLTWTADFEAMGLDSTYWIQTQLRPFAEFSSTVVDFFLQPEEVFREEAAQRSEAGKPAWTGVYAIPADSAEAPLPHHQLRIALLRGEADYASFATTRDDPDRREPLSNIDGALGIATAITLDVREIDITPETVGPVSAQDPYDH